jgi:putative chitinase
MTPKQLRAVMPNAGSRADTYAAPLTAAAAEFDINTPRRLAAFIAQIAHESGELRYVREIWGPTAAQRGYEGRADLGNTQPGDGRRFMGRGFLQITGRSNYRAVGAALGVDLLTAPERLEEPELAARSAGWFWRDRDLNRMADADQFAAISRRINGGYNGIDDRIACWLLARDVFGV